MIETGVKLQLPQETVSTAVVLFHRFFLLRSFTKYFEIDHMYIPTSCLFLATKAEENPRRIRDVIGTSHHVLHPTEPPMPLDEDYWDYKEKLVKYEQLVLRVLMFDMDVSHPFRFLLNFGRLLRVSRAVTQTAWALIVDALFEPLLLRYRPPDVAAAALYVAARLLKQSQMMTTVEGRAACWWHAFDVSTEVLEEIASLLVGLYEQGGIMAHGPQQIS